MADGGLSIILGLAIGAAVSAAVAVPQAIITAQAAQAQADYQSAVYQAYAIQQDREAKVEAEEIKRQAKFTFASQRANAAAMGSDITTSSAGDIQYMSAGMAALDEQKKLYEGQLALWEGNVRSQMAQYEAKVTKYNAWTSAAINIGMGAAIGAASGGIGAGLSTGTSTATSVGSSLGSKLSTSVGTSFFSKAGSALSSAASNVYSGYRTIGSPSLVTVNRRSY